MNNFFLTFITSYIGASASCLLLDIFNPSIRKHEDTLENIVKHYKHVSNTVGQNIFVTVLPLYLFLEIYYYNYESNRGIFVQYLQILLSIFMGLVLHLFSAKMFRTNMFKKYVTHDKSISYNFGWQTFYLHPVELYLVYLLPPILIPVIFSFGPGIVQLLINISNIVYVIRNSSLVYSNYIDMFIYDFEYFLHLNINVPVNQNFQVINSDGDTHEESVSDETNNETNKTNHHTQMEKKIEKQINIQGANVSENLHLD